MAKPMEVSNMKPKVNNMQAKAKGEPEGKAKKKKTKTKSKKKKSIPTHPDHNLRFARHVTDWILAVSSLCSLAD